MIKKIPISQLRLGMYIHDLDLGWIDHPFLQNRFKLTNQADLDKILSLQLREVYIDTAKGLDILDQTAGIGKNLAEVQHEIQKSMEDLAKKYPDNEYHAPRNEEWQRAQLVMTEANQVVTHMLEDVRLGKQLEVERLEPVIGQIVKSVFRNQDALMGMIRIREMDKYTFEHSVSVSVLLTAFCKSLGMPYEIIHQAAIGGILHDIGKVKIPLEILNKPGPLAEQEFITMRGHVNRSMEIIESLSEISEISRAIIVEHHERYDGSGYPFQKKEEEISLHGQMAAIVDVYDALTSNRCYHKGKSPHWVLGKLIEWSKYHFNPTLVQKFIRCIGVYPVGTLVLLQSGRLGVVIELNEGDLLRPIIKLAYDKNRQRHLSLTTLNLARQDITTPDRIIGSESPEIYNLRVDMILNSKN